MKNISSPPVYAVLLALLLTACGPSKEQQARNVERMRQQCLNDVCEGETPPKYDWAKETILKRGGKWFRGPKEYFSSGHSATFYWPSKHPGFTETNYPEKGQPFNLVAIEFWVDVNDGSREESQIDIPKLEKEGKLIGTRQLRNGLELVEIKSYNNQVGQMYIATSLKTPSGLLPVVGCDESDSRNACTSWFIWKPGYRIYVRFSSLHGKDWPEIYSEIIRVLNLLKEA